MKEEEMIKLIIGLSRSQGFYGRLYTYLVELQKCDKSAYKELINEWESQNFQDDLDFILYLEQ